MTPKTKKVPRQSNAELLRILAMVGIIAHHLTVHGGVTYDIGSMSPLQLLSVETLLAGGKIGVDIFVLISGYFMSASKGLRASKVLSLWSQLLTYSLAIFIVFTLTGTQVPQVPEGTALTLVRSFRPIATQIWWFASTYFVILILSPFLNAMIGALSRGMMRRMLVAMLCVWSILPSLVVDTWPCGTVPWFSFLYCLSAYVRKYGLVEKVSQGRKRSAICILGGIGCAILAALAGAFVMTHQDTFSQFMVTDKTIVCSVSNILIFLSAFLVFLGFLGIDMGRNTIVNIVASATFGIYLIHDHPWVRRWLWNDVVGHVDITGMRVIHLMPMAMRIVVEVFCVCMLVELIRQWTIGWLLRNPIDRLSILIEQAIDKVLPASDAIVCDQGGETKSQIDEAKHETIKQSFKDCQLEI